MSIWTHQSYRHRWVDQTFSIHGTRISAMGHFGQAGLDVGLFLRPFNTDCWIIIMAVTLALALAMLCHQKINNGMSSNIELQSSGRIVILSSWIFFLLVNAFYGGALTMFFASRSGLPFENVEEAMSMWSRWKMVAVRPEILYIPKNGPEGYLAGMEEEGLIFDSYKSAFEMLKKPGYFYFGSQEIAIGKFLKLKKPQPHLQLLQPHELKSSTIVFPKNSPITQMFNTGKF